MAGETQTDTAEIVRGFQYFIVMPGPALVMAINIIVYLSKSSNVHSERSTGGQWGCPNKEKINLIRDVLQAAALMDGMDFFKLQSQ